MYNVVASTVYRLRVDARLREGDLWPNPAHQHPQEAIALFAGRSERGFSIGGRCRRAGIGKWGVANVYRATWRAQGSKKPLVVRGVIGRDSLQHGHKLPSGVSDSLDAMTGQIASQPVT